MRRRALLISAVSGGLWALIPALLFTDAKFWGPFVFARWFACLAGPPVGMGVYLASRWSYNHSVWIRALWAVVTVYLSAAVYGAAMGTIAWFQGSHADLFVTALLPIFPFWWGLTMVPFFWILFVVAVANQEVVRRSEQTA